MKVQPLQALTPTQSVTSRRQASQAPHAAGPDRVGLSNTASWITSMQAQASSTSEVRPDAVAEARQMIADGSIDSDANLEAAASALLLEL